MNLSDNDNLAPTTTVDQCPTEYSFRFAVGINIRRIDAVNTFVNSTVDDSNGLRVGGRVTEIAGAQGNR